MTDRRDDDFRAPQRPEEPGQGPGPELRFKVLKQAGKASSGKSRCAVRHRLAGIASGRPRAWGAAICIGSTLRRGDVDAHVAARVTIKTLLVNHQRASPQSWPAPAPHRARRRAGRDGEPGRRLRAADRRGRP